MASCTRLCVSNDVAAELDALLIICDGLELEGLDTLGDLKEFQDGQQ